MLDSRPGFQLLSSAVAKEDYAKALPSAAVRAPKSKTQERLEIERQVQDFLRQGGQVQSVQPGVSGKELGARLPPVSFQQPKMTRTSLIEEVRAIEARRHPSSAPKRPQSKSPRKVLITDDFGEPLRWRWRES
jgi:hypothetical protein